MLRLLWVRVCLRWSPSGSGGALPVVNCIEDCAGKMASGAEQNNVLIDYDNDRYNG